MKQIIVSTVLLFFACTFCFGQPNVEERIQQERIAFFDKELQLTEAESKQFWPLYDQYREDEQQLKSSYDQRRKIELLSDKEVEELVFKSFELEEKQLALRRAYFEKLRNFMSIRKIAMLKRTEQKFKKKLLNHIKQRRKRRQQGKRKN